MGWKIGLSRYQHPVGWAPDHSSGRGDPRSGVSVSNRVRYKSLETVVSLAYLLKQCMSGFFVSNRKGFGKLKTGFMNFEL